MARENANREPISDLMALSLDEISRKLDKLFDSMPPYDTAYSMRHDLQITIAHHVKVKLVKTIEATTGRELVIAVGIGGMHYKNPCLDFPTSPNLFRWYFTPKYPKFPVNKFSEWSFQQLQECNRALDKRFMYPIDLKKRSSSNSQPSKANTSHKPTSEHDHTDGEQDEAESFIPRRSHRRRTATSRDSLVKHASDSSGLHQEEIKDQFEPIDDAIDQEDTRQDMANVSEQEEEELLDSIQDSWNKLNQLVSHKNLLISELKSQLQTQAIRIQELEEANEAINFNPALDCLATEFGKKEEENKRLHAQNASQATLISKLREENQALKSSSASPNSELRFQILQSHPESAHNSPKQAIHKSTSTPGPANRPSLAGQSSNGLKSTDGGQSNRGGVRSDLLPGLTTSGFHSQGQKRKTLTEEVNSNMRKPKLMRKSQNDRHSTVSNSSLSSLNKTASPAPPSSQSQSFHLPRHD